MLSKIKVDNDKECFSRKWTKTSIIFGFFFILAVLSLHSCLAYKKKHQKKNLPYTYACTLKNVGKEKDHFHDYRSDVMRRSRFFFKRGMGVSGVGYICLLWGRGGGGRSRKI